MATVATQDDFQQKVLDAKGVTLVDFWADWCAPCHALTPILHQVEEELGDRVKVIKVNVDENQQLAMQHGISSIPTVKLFKDGKEAETLIGVMPKVSYVSIIEQYEK